MDTRSKIVSAAEARARVEEWRAQGRAVEVVTGLFDPLLAAHAEQLEGAVAEGSLVLVQVEEGADAVLALSDRCVVVAALRRVDLVCAGAPLPATRDFVRIDEELKRQFRCSVPD